LAKSDKYVEEARRELIASNAFTFLIVLGSTPHLVISLRNMYWKATTEGLLFHPPRTNKLLLNKWSKVLHMKIYFHLFLVLSGLC